MGICCTVTYGRYKVMQRYFIISHVKALTFACDCEWRLYKYTTKCFKFTPVLGTFMTKMYFSLSTRMIHLILQINLFI